MATDQEYFQSQELPREILVNCVTMFMCRQNNPLTREKAIEEAFCIGDDIKKMLEERVSDKLAKEARRKKGY